MFSSSQFKPIQKNGERPQINLHRENVAPWPSGVPSGFCIAQIVACSIRNRLPVFEILTPR